MKKTIPLLLFCVLSVASLFAQPVKATLLGNWHDDDLVVVPWINGRYNEVWGLAVNNHEFAVLGSTAGMHIIDVTDPTDPQELFLIEGTSMGSNVVHRDFKDYNGYLYAVADEGGSATLQIIDIQNLPNSVTQVYASNEFVVTSHNLFIDTSQARLYLLGAQGKTKILDISNPEQPVLLGSYPNASFYMPYVHDAYIRDHIGVFNCANDGLWVIDFTDPDNPVLLGTMTNYPGAGYNHSGWLSEDGNYYYLLDETHGSPVKVVDMSDFSDMEVVATVDAESAPTQIPHNAIIRDNLLYVSYYYDGLQVYDISNPLNPQRVVYYDTYFGPDASFYAGAWGIYPLLPSGNILVSDIQSGLWVFEALPDFQNLNLIPSQTQFNACAGETVSFTLTLGTDFSDIGVNFQLVGGLPGLVTFSPNPAPPGSTVVVTIENLNSTMGMTEELTIQATDGTNSNTADIHLQVNEIPAASTQLFPASGAVNVPLKPDFQWSAVAGATGYRLQVSSNLSNFESGIVYSATTSNLNFPLSSNLEPNKTYHWRVVSQNSCGSTTSGIQAFTTEGGNATTALEINTFKIFPNPVLENLMIAFETPTGNRLDVTLLSVTGEVKLQQKINPGASTVKVKAGDLPPGIYFLKISSDGAAVIRKVIVQ